MYFSILESGGLTAERLRGWTVGGPSSRGQTADFSLCPCVVEGAGELSEVPFTRTLIPFTGSPPS